MGGGRPNTWVIGQDIQDKKIVPCIMTEVPARWFDRKMKGRKIWLKRRVCLFFCPYFLPIFFTRRLKRSWNRKELTISSTSAFRPDVLQDSGSSVKPTQYRLQSLILFVLVTAIAMTAVVYRSALVQTAGERFIGSKDGMDLCESFEREIRAGMPLRTVQALIGWGYELPTNERDEFLQRIESQPNSTYIQRTNDRVFVYTTNMSRSSSCRLSR